MPRWEHYLPLSKVPAKRGHVVATTSCPTMLPVRFQKGFQKHFCVRHKCCARSKTTFGKHARVSIVAATMCSRFAAAWHQYFQNQAKMADPVLPVATPTSIAGASRDHCLAPDAAPVSVCISLRVRSVCSLKIVDVGNDFHCPKMRGRAEGRKAVFIAFVSGFLPL